MRKKQPNKLRRILQNGRKGNRREKMGLLFPGVNGSCVKCRRRPVWGVPKQQSDHRSLGFLPERRNFKHQSVYLKHEFHEGSYTLGLYLGHCVPDTWTMLVTVYILKNLVEPIIE